MTRINTNISSMNAQKTLARSNDQLQEAMTRLSTGLRINSGKDDPAGLIASEMLRADIVSTERAITNSQRANQLIATADSALSQVSTLLIEVRGLVTEAANEGALSQEQIEANQLQVDAALESLNRISQITNFQGRKLLDGSLDFITEAGANFEKAQNLEIQQANLGATGQMGLSIDVTAAATQAQVDIEVAEAIAAESASADFEFTNTAEQATGSFETTGDAGTLSIEAVPGEDYDGTAGDLTVRFEIDGDLGDDTAEASVADGTMTVKVHGTGTTWETIVDAMKRPDEATGDQFDVSVDGTDTTTFDDEDAQFEMTGGRDAGSATIEITADEAGTDANDVQIVFDQGDHELGATINEDGDTITVALSNTDTVTYADIAAAISTVEGYSAEITASDGDQDFIGDDDSPPSDGELDGGVDAGGGLSHDVVFTLAGRDGSEMFSFSAGTSIDQMQSAIGLLNDSTGVSANVDGQTLELMSNAYGSESFVDVKLVSEDPDGTITAAVGQGRRNVGTDIEGRVNGTEATGRANALSLDTATLAMSLDVEAGFAGNIGLNISGGGAMFQVGPEVVSNQQARIGIGSVNTATLGGVSGRMYELGSGRAAGLAVDPGKAAEIVDEVIGKVTSLQGRLGAFQKTTLDSNIESLNDTLENLVSAESSIRDADFAVEAAAMTRAQILVQSGTSVLSIANSNPQNVLALLG